MAKTNYVSPPLQTDVSIVTRTAMKAVIIFKAPRNIYVIVQ